MILALAPLALGKPACEGLAGTATVPSAFAEDVPVDVRLAVLFEDDGCFQDEVVALALTRADDGVVVAASETPIEEAAALGMAELFPDEPLSPHTAYVLSGGGSDIGFTTGEVLVASLEGAPTLLEAAAGWQRARPNFHIRSGIELDWAAAPAADPDGLSILQLRDETSPDRADATLAREPSASVFWANATRPAEVCPQVRQVDGAGRATDWSEPLCVGVSCGTDATQSIGALLMSAMLLAARRR